MLADLRRALRALRREPGFVAAAVVTLSLGIGANAAMFGVVDALLYRPPPGVGAPEGLVRLTTIPDPAAGKQTFFFPNFSYPEYEALRAPSGPFGALAAYTGQELTLDAGARAQKKSVLFVSGDYFTTLQAQPALGRALVPADDRAGATPVAVVGHGFWRSVLGGDSAAVGRVLHFGDRPVQIVGVARENFVGMDLDEPDLFIPLSAAVAAGAASSPRSPTGRSLTLVGRPRAGVSRAAATGAVNAIMRAITRVGAPKSSGARVVGESQRLIVLGDAAHRIAGARAENPVPVWLLGATFAVLLIACANVASLALARAERRRRDAAVRVSLGAGVWRLVRQAFAESALLAFGGALGGILIAAWSTQLVGLLSLPPLPPLLGIRVIAVTALLAFLSMLFAGVGPALATARVDPASALGAHSGRGSARTSRAQTLLTAGQLALSLTLLVTAGLFVRSLRNARLADVGFDLQHTLVVSLDLTNPRYDAARADALMRDADARLRHLPGVRDVSFGWFAPFGGAVISQPHLPGAPAPDAAQMVPGNEVDPGYFRTLGATMVHGRTFTAEEIASNAPVVVISAKTARIFWPAGDALGNCLVTSDTECRRVVGVVGDMHTMSLAGEPLPQVFMPLGRDDVQRSAINLFVRTTDDPAELAARVRAAIQSLDAALPYVGAQPGLDLIHRELVVWEVAAVAFTVFGAAALLLASVGLYAVMAYTVAQRTREVGIRMALGAVQRDVVRMLVARGARVAGVGLVVGIVGALAVGRALQAKFFGVSPLDPPTYVAVAALLALAALLASWLPARRAARVDPAIALRAE